jgi:DNA-binding response OmpR family regulator
LIVDDEPDITSSFDMILQMNGFEVDTYNDPLLPLDILFIFNLFSVG